jgi:putative chitinase
MAFTLTKEHLSQLLPKNQYLDEWLDALNAILPDYEIDTPARIAGFIAQTAHESGNYSVLTENLNYRAVTLRKVFPKYFPTDALAESYAGKPEKIANKVYGGRMGNGAEATGDGFKYCGRGLIQLTGKDNYTAFAESLDMEVEEVPEYLETFEGAVQSACWYWEARNLNACADSKDIVTMTRKINGGTIGLEDRKKHFEHALHVLGV